MPKIPANARTTDLAQTAQMGRQTGFLSRVGQAVRFAIRGVQPDTWMSPAQPVQPVAQEAFGRRFDYPVGANLVYTPRHTELTTFQQLRALADNCDIVRLCIETRKDQMERQRWKIQRTDGSSSEDDAKAKAIEAKLRRPDGDHSWNTWMRMVIEEMLVIDATSIVPRKTVGGSTAFFELIDGSLIKVLVDDTGRKPLAPDPAYQQVIKGMPAVNYSADELVYRPRNPRVHKFYGFSPVEQLQITVNIAIRRAVSQLQYFTAGNIPEAFASVPKEWTPQQVEEFQKYWDAVIEGTQEAKRQVRFVPGDMKVSQVRDAPLKDDFDEWLARVACYAFSLPSTPFVKMMNRATADTAEEAALEEGLSPLKEWFRDLMNLLIERYLDGSGYEFAWSDEKALDPEQQSKIHVAYLEKGAITINEVRKDLGREPVAGGDVAMVLTRTGAVRVEDAAAPKPAPETEPPTPQHEGDAASGGAPNPADPNNPDDAAEPAKKKVTKAASSEPKPEPIDRNRPEIVAAEERIRKAIESGLDLSREEIVKQIAAAAPEGAKPADIEGLADRLQLEGLARAHDDILGALTDAAKDGGQQGLTQLQVGDEDMTALVNDKAVEFANERAAQLITSDANGGELLAATRDMIRQTVRQAIEEGWSNERLANELQDSYAFSKKRAALIARTETAFADSRGNLAAYLASGVVKDKRWILDPDPCPVCIANAAAGNIPLGDEFPGGVMAPPQHPNCRCDFAPIIEE